MLRQQRAATAPEHIFTRSPVFRRLRNWPSERDHRPAELNVYVYEQFLTLPKMDAMRAYLAGYEARHVAMAVLDMMRLAACQEPAGTIDRFCLGMRGRLVEDWGIPSELLLGAMLSANMVRHLGDGVCVFSAPEIVTFSQEQEAAVDVQALVDRISRGPFMAAKAISCGKTSGPVQLRLGQRRPAARAAGL